MNGIDMNSALMYVSANPSPNSIAGAVSIKMLDQTMEMSEEMNSEMIKMMENSVTPHLGGNIDTYV